MGKPKKISPNRYVSFAKSPSNFFGSKKEKKGTPFVDLTETTFVPQHDDDRDFSAESPYLDSNVNSSNVSINTEPLPQHITSNPKNSQLLAGQLEKKDDSGH